MKINTTEQTRYTVQNYLQFLQERNLEGILPLFAKKVDWSVPGNVQNAPWTGKRNTKGEVRQFFEELWKNTLTLDATVEHLLIDGSFAIVTGYFTTKMLKTGKVVNSLFSIHIGVKDNLIVKYRLQEDSYAVSEAMDK